MFDRSEFLWAIINFAIFFAVLRIVFYKPVLKMLDERRRRVEETLARSDQARREAENLRADYERKLAAAQQESRELVQRASAQAEQAKDEIVAQAGAEASRLLEKAREGIRVEKEKALSELRKEVAGLAVAVAEKVVMKTLTPQDHDRLIKEFVSEVGEAG